MFEACEDALEYGSQRRPVTVVYAKRVLRKIEDDLFREVLYNGKHGSGFAGMVL